MGSQGCIYKLKRFIKPIFGLSDKIGLLVLLEAVQASASVKCEKPKVPEILEESKIKMSIA